MGMLLSTLGLLRAADNGDKGLRCWCMRGHTRHSSPQVGWKSRGVFSPLGQEPRLSSAGCPFLFGREPPCSGSKASCPSDASVLKPDSGWGRSGVSDEADERPVWDAGMKGSEES